MLIGIVDTDIAQLISAEETISSVIQ